VRSVSDSSFVLVANGNADSPPASGVRDWLAERARRLVAVFHPLSPEDPPLHRVAEWREGVLAGERTVRLPSRPPMTYPLDALVPLRRDRHDGWLAFSNLSACHGLVRRRLGRAGKVAYWAVDFAPDRFGRGSVLTRVYDAVDRVASTDADLRVELTEAARDGRTQRLQLGADAAPTHVAPVGTWVERVERVAEDGWRQRRVVFTGHLVARQGVDTLVRAVALLRDVQLDIAGRGPEEERLRALAGELGITERVTFHGFLAVHRDVERLVASGSVAAAPYSTRMESFTRYADPSKLRTYTAAGLPIVLTDVPPNAAELRREAGAAVVDDAPEAVARAIGEVLDDPADWQRRREAALAYARRFDWALIVPTALERLGFVG
jgi:glycosyltransferase involved in cell wall biosynthesis